MTNVVVNVESYTQASLALLSNTNPFIKLTNKKYKHIEGIPGQRGTTALFDEPPTVDYVPSLAFGTFGSYTQKSVPISVEKEGSIPLGTPELEKLFNIDVDNYMTPLAKSGVVTLGTKVGKDVALNCKEHTYLTYGDGTDSIQSYQSLDQAIENYRDAGNPITDEMCGIIPMTACPKIIGNGLTQFAPSRNDEIANSWELGEFAGVKWYKSNLLPRHVAGTVGDQATVLTVVSINAAGTQLTLSGAANSDANAIKKYDILTFSDGISGQPDMRYLTYFGSEETNSVVQVRAQSDVASDETGEVIIDIFPALISTSGDRDSNINNAVTAGMQMTAKKSHVCGLLFAKSAFMLAMPKLVDTSPYENSTMTDPSSGISLRTYNGYFPQTAVKGFVQQVAWGSRLADRYGMRLAFPTSNP
ncbi:hypothetical protein [uncultured Paraglaciecola sp.]|uniref:hypothetical protein n=1 Tax=uncultured Paraglaciecola sp. TaxID=1765024 RepID=UPI002639810F|nr:hypothetical protein [uncultured Paraglaciecola sp.]